MPQHFVDHQSRFLTSRIVSVVISVTLTDHSCCTSSLLLWIRTEVTNKALWRRGSGRTMVVSREGLWRFSEINDFSGDLWAERNCDWILTFLSLRFGKTEHGKNEIKILHTYWFSHSPPPPYIIAINGKKLGAEFLKLLEWSKLRLWSSALWQWSFTADFLYSRSGLAVEDCPKHHKT